jgi:hypothetical protein
MVRTTLDLKQLPLLALLTACESTGPGFSADRAVPPILIDPAGFTGGYEAVVPGQPRVDSSSPPIPRDSAPSDSIPGPGVDSVPSSGDPPGPVIPGIPFGVYHLPPELLGPAFSGALRASPPESLLVHLALARRAGAKVIVSFAGAERRFRNSDNTFSFTKWKYRIDRYRQLDFSSYIADGTIVGHYIMDEPHDPGNWGGTLVSREMVDEMAKYSKEVWPTMLTIVRSWPAYLKGYKYQYLDAAWAAYSERKGPIDSFISSNVEDAKEIGLGLVVSLNLLDGGTKSSGIPGYNNGKYGMSASQVRSWGGALLSEDYVCAFMMWKYNEPYLSRPDIKAALSDLRDKARSHPKKACRH